MFRQVLLISQLMQVLIFVLLGQAIVLQLVILLVVPLVMMHSVLLLPVILWGLPWVEFTLPFVLLISLEIQFKQSCHLGLDFILDPSSEEYSCMKLNGWEKQV